ncbi:MAG: hypothetical protein KDD82_25695 [Planctomycetes bacterium]|nr:hypothetical protein [Planctomycetota bacterium]
MHDRDRGTPELSGAGGDGEADPYAPPSSELSGGRADRDWRSLETLIVRQEFGLARQFAVLDDEEEPRLLLRARGRVANHFDALFPGDPPSSAGFELRYRVGLMSRELRITELARSGLWRRAAFGRWRLEVSEPRWNRARLKQGLIGGATLVDPHGGPVATLRTRTLRRGVWLELEPGTEFPRAWALGLALAYAIAGS